MSKPSVSRGSPLLFRELLGLPNGSLVWVRYWDPGEKQPSLDTYCTLTREDEEDTWYLDSGTTYAGEFSHTEGPEDPCEDTYEGSRTLLYKIKTTPDRPLKPVP